MEWNTSSEDISKIFGRNNKVGIRIFYIFVLHARSRVKNVLAFGEVDDLNIWRKGNDTDKHRQ